MRLLTRLAPAAICFTFLLCAAPVDKGIFPKNIVPVKIPSAALGQDRNVNILLPLNYETSTARYPVLYLLHGLGDDQNAWAFMTNLSAYAARRRMIIVMPDGGRSFYVNSATDPKARFEDFIVKDLVSWVDANYRTIPLRRARAIAGLSMGGYGSALLGLKHYQMFTALGLFSGALGVAHEPPVGPLRPGLQKQIDPLIGAPGSAERRERDPFLYVEKVPPAQMPDIYIACGGQDFLFVQNRAFVELLATKQIPYEYREVSPRVHSWDFWDEQIRVFLNLLERKHGF